MSPKNKRTTPTRATREAEAQEADADHGAVEDEEFGGDSGAPALDVDETVEEHYRDMTKRGAEATGEGRIP
jgi:hypothetical protein